MRKFATLGLALVAGVATALVSAQLMPTTPEPVHAKAMWKDIYRKPLGLVAGADVIVVATHVSAEPGRMVGETPFTNNTFQIQSVRKGTHVGDTLVVEQTGGLRRDNVLFGIDDGGSYTPGGSYLLFLKTGEPGMYYVINHQARYEIVDNMLVGVDPHDPVVAKFHARPFDEGLQMIDRRVEALR